jgi:hypothetical protein
MPIATEFELKIPGTGRKTKIRRGDVIIFTAGRHSYVRAYRPAIENWLYFLPNVSTSESLDHRDFMIIASAIFGAMGFRIERDVAWEEKLKATIALKII